MDRELRGEASRRRLVASYIAAAFLFMASLYVYVPTLSVYVASRTGDLAVVGIVLSMYGLWQAVIRLPLGIVADRVGRRKPFIIGGFLFSALGALTMGLAHDTAGLALGRAFTGFAAGAWVLLVVGLSSLFPPEEAVRASAIVSAVSAIARVIATSVTGTLNTVGGYMLPFMVAIAIALLGLGVMLLVPERSVASRSRPLREVGALITRREVLLPALLGTILLYAVWSSTFGFTPNLANELGASDVVLSMLTSLNVAVVMAANLATTVLARRMDERTLVRAGFICMGLGMAVLALARSVHHVFVGQVLMGLAAGTGYPVLMGLSIRYVEEEQRATAMGLFQAVYAVGMFTGPWLSGILADGIGIQPMFAVTGAVCLVLGLIGARMLGVRVESQQEVSYAD